MTAPTAVRDLPVGQRRIIRAWCMYDWANSAFATSGVAAIIPIYFVFLFKDALGESVSFLGLTLTGSSTWSLGVAISTAIVALSSPILGIIADRAALKKTLLGVYAAAGSLFTALAFFSAYTSHPWAWIAGTFILANIGFAGSLVFYNSLLPHIAPRGLLDDVSSRGFSYGYIGGGLLLLVHLALNVLARDTDAADLVTRLSIASVGVWWFGWAVWTLKVVPEPTVREAADRLTPWRALTMAAGQLGRTFRQVRRFRVVLAYLGAYLLFNDGVQTIISIAGAFAADTLGIPLAFNMATILIIQFVAAGGAMAFAWLARRTDDEDRPHRGARRLGTHSARRRGGRAAGTGQTRRVRLPVERFCRIQELDDWRGSMGYTADAVPDVGETRTRSRMWRSEGHAIRGGRDASLQHGPGGCWRASACPSTLLTASRLMAAFWTARRR